MAQYLSSKEFSGTTLAEAITSEGRRYYSEFDEVFTSGETKYFLYQFPSKMPKGLVVGLQNRQFKSLNGEAEITILWDSTGVVPGTPVPIFNENRNSPNVSEVVISEIVAPTTEGTIREQDFLTGSGAGSKSSGDVSVGSGYRGYSPDSFFIAKVTNLHNANNRIRLAYSWVEVFIESIG